jgi:hypothetical protein
VADTPDARAFAKCNRPADFLNSIAVFVSHLQPST